MGLIYVDALKKAIVNYPYGLRGMIYEDINVQPTIDAVPVVRCKDCKHNYGKKHNEGYNHEDIVCDYWETDGLNENDFCSYGERSEDEHTD